MRLAILLLLLAFPRLQASLQTRIHDQLLETGKEAVTTPSTRISRTPDSQNNLSATNLPLVESFTVRQSPSSLRAVMTTSQAQLSSRQYHTMDDRMDMDPPSPQRLGPPLQHRQHASFQSACPAMRATNDHLAPMPPNMGPAHYDPVHSSIDNSWTRDHWHAPPLNHTFTHQRLPPFSDSFQNSYHQPSVTAPGPASFQPQPNQLPFGYQAAHAPALLAPGSFSGPPANAPASFGRSNVSAAGQGGQGPLGAQRQAQPSHGAQSFGTENAIGQSPQQFTPSTDLNMLAAFGHTSLRPQPSTNQQGSSSFHSFAATWQSQQWVAGPQGKPHQTLFSILPPLSSSFLLHLKFSGRTPITLPAAFSHAAGPPLPLAISHPHAPRAPHSSRRHRHSMPRSATITNGDLDDPVSPRSRQPSAVDDRLREAQAFRGSLITKRVASLKAIKSLRSVPISELPEDERSKLLPLSRYCSRRTDHFFLSAVCNICYNEFGVETPEKVTETPVRLPGCKHVFGDRCIKTWFEDSNLCPYCREAMESEMRSFMPQAVHGALSTPGANQLRAVLLQNPEMLQRIYDDPELVNELILGRMHPSDAHDDLAPSSIHPQERRGPPTNSEDGHRRQRPRRGSWVAVAMPPHQGSYLGRTRVVPTEPVLRGTDSGRRGSSQRRSATPPQLVRSGASTSTNLSQMTTRSQAARPSTLPAVDTLPQIRALPLFPQRDMIAPE